MRGDGAFVVRPYRGLMMKSGLCGLIETQRSTAGWGGVGCEIEEEEKRRRWGEGGGR